MALKFGRTAGITSRIDPKGTIMYDEDEYDAYMTAVEAEKSRKSAYDESVKKYDTQYNSYYGKNTVDTKAASAAADLLNKSNAKESKGGNIVATAAKGMSQADSDKEIDAKIKSGQIVPFSSLDAKTRELMTGAAGGADLSKTYANTGTKFKDYKEIYGDDFNPVIWKSEAKAGRFPYGEGFHTPKADIGTYTKVGAPVKPGEYVPANIKKIDPKNVDWKETKIDPVPLKGTKITQKEGKLVLPKEKEELTWQAPNLDKRKKASFMRATRITPTKTATGENIVRTGIHNAARIKQSDAVSPQRIKYNTERRQSAAYFSGKTSSGDDITGKTESELRGLKKETKEYLKHVRKQDGMSRQDVKDVRGDIGTIRKATRYAKKGDISVGSVGEETGVTREGQGSKLRYFTPEFKQVVQEDGKYTRGEGAMYGYQKYQAQEKDKAYRAQNENAANKNTIGSQMQKLQGAAATPSIYSASDTRSQMKNKFATANPTASRSQIRQGVRTEIQTNKQLMKDVQETQKKKGMY
jgi:hypothetical protein